MRTKCVNPVVRTTKFQHIMMMMQETLATTENSLKKEIKMVTETRNNGASTASMMQATETVIRYVIVRQSSPLKLFLLLVLQVRGEDGYGTGNSGRFE